jgi:predicted ATPase
MKILEVTIGGYKNLEETTIMFSGGGITALVAPNNYGKSNFLESLDFAYDFLQGLPDKKKKMMKYYPAIPINNNLATAKFHFGIKFTTIFNNEEYFAEYWFEFDWEKNKNQLGSKIVAESLKIKKNVTGKFTTIIKRNNNTAFYQSSPTGRCDKKVEITSNNLVVNKLVNDDNLYYNQIIKSLLLLQFTINELMDIEPAFSGIQLSSKDSLVIEKELENGHNVSKFLYSLRKRNYSIYQILLNSVKDLLPEIEDIEPQEIDLKMKDNDELKNVPFTFPEKIYDLRIKEKNNNQTTSIKYVSRGTKRILLILATAVFAHENNIQLLAYEELENSIHPSLLQRLLIILKELVPNLTILISSHSPYLIQYLPIEKIYLGVPNKKSIAVFKKIKKVKYKAFYKNALDENITIGDYLFDFLLDKELYLQDINEFFE